ncbi:MAG: FKBP-type peptidyl-prolyl cis-trans isomerase, partial [Candidatus Sumerlaeota bacterium]
QYNALEETKGKSPDMDSLVTVHYEGKLMDGTVFDSSYKRGEPAQFHLRQVVPGFGEGITLMNTGEKYRLFIPPALGYGPQAPSPQIPANALLIFDVELIDFEEQKMPENPQMQQKRR